MFPNRTNPKLQLVAVGQQSPVGSGRPAPYPLPGEAQFPGPPAMPHALLQLELCLSAYVVDLQDITNIIRSDVGLMVQILRLAAREAESPTGKIHAVSEIAIQLGVVRLGELATQTKPLPDYFRGQVGASRCVRFWTHARLSALIAEELASRSWEVSPEEAYVAGLLYRVGDLPSVLGWTTTGSGGTDFHHIGYQMAKAWEFPRGLADVIGGYGEIGRTDDSRKLLELAESADNWASRFELLSARGAMKSETSVM
ncbi:MAG: HDOD domain-containing protein [Terriglobales bacterium]